MFVMGVDPSLTGTGVATIDTVTGEWKVFTVLSKPTGQTVKERTLRIGGIVGEIFSVDHVPDLLVIEQPAYSSRTGHQHDRSGLWWDIVWTSEIFGIQHVIEVPPSSRAKYGTGKGTSGKDVVMLAAAKRYPHADIADNNQADAVLLAAMGCRILGLAVDDLPKTHTEAVKKVMVPDGLEIA